MVVLLERSIRDDDKERVRAFLTTKGFTVREIVGEEETILGAVGIVSIDLREVEVLPGVARVIPISKPYKLASREFKKMNTVISVGPVKIGGARIVVIAGPCAVESREQIEETASIVKSSGGVMLRGGAFKPRTSPYSFQGLGEEGLRLLREVGDREGLPVVSEIVSPEYAPRMADFVDAFQIGARNMQNFELLKRVGAVGKPVFLKRGMAATIEEWLMAAEYLLAHGTDDVVLCERGIRTFETYTRNTLDISAIPVVRKLSHLPVVVDPSHATGIRDKVPPLALASVAAGADGILVEVHPRPEEAASDGPQSLYPEQFEKLVRDIEVLSPVVGKEVARLPKSVTVQAVGDASRGSRQVVAFQGEHGAYSELAAHRYFDGSDIESRPCQAFQGVFESVLAGKSLFGVVPIENSLAGSVHENYDLLLQYSDLSIVGEQRIRIVHNLIGANGASISGLTKIFSHPQGLAQCSAFIRSLPEAEGVPFYDTAASVSHVADSGRKDWAAIASAEAAAHYQMSILKEGIETNPLNYTRFFVISRSATSAEDANIASIVFETPDKPGALFEALQILSNESLNMHKIESRPIHGRPWEYMFYVDVEIPDPRSEFDRALERLKETADSFRVLGRYRAVTQPA